MGTIVLLILILGLSAAGSAIYFPFASKYGPYATPNYRSLHRQVIPRGAGLALAVASLLGYGFLYCKDLLNGAQAWVYLVGGFVVLGMGVADDRLDIRARYRMPFQILTAIWTLHWLGVSPRLEFGFGAIDLGTVGWLVLLAALVWFYNLYNFIDGIDGMAASAAIFLCASMGTVLSFDQQHALSVILMVLGAASTGFLFFNWPPARMFLGESGSSFMSLVFGAVCVESICANPGLLWTWLIAGSFYFCDTTLTTLVRVLKVPGWYRPHRSHAYQNLARVWNDHRKVVLRVLMINLFWVTPLLLLSLKYEAWAIGVTVLVYIPLAVFCLKYGPLYANK